jgi:hypothetical protein
MIACKGDARGIALRFPPSRGSRQYAVALRAGIVSEPPHIGGHSHAYPSQHDKSGNQGTYMSEKCSDDNGSARKNIEDVPEAVIAPPSIVNNYPTHLHLHYIKAIRAEQTSVYDQPSNR